ncbi:hypothetical protein Taro_020179, partial [Colocasia esculenta]|nr:hypothetical protein [Colocasia esculenta]
PTVNNPRRIQKPLPRFRHLPTRLKVRATARRAASAVEREMAELKREEEGGSAGAEAAKDHLKAAGGELLPDGRCGVRLKGWLVESRKLPILNSAGREHELMAKAESFGTVEGLTILLLDALQIGETLYSGDRNKSQALEELWEQKLGTSHLPEMVFGDNSLHLLHEKSGLMLHFNAFDALKEWKKESLPPVEVPAAAKWKFRSKPSQQVILDYDYTFTTPYSGSERIEPYIESVSDNSQCQVQWEDCDEQIDLAALATREPILFYDEVILYEDELADNGVSLLTVKVRVMPSCWFLLLRFWVCESAL